MFKGMLLESLDKIEESVVAPYVGQRLNSIGKETGVDFTVVFANDKIIKVKDGKGKVKTYTAKEFANQFSLAGEVANESVTKDGGNSYFTLDIDVDKGEFEDAPEVEIAAILRSVADRLTDGDMDGVFKNSEDEVVGKFNLVDGKLADTDEPIEEEDYEDEEPIEEEEDEEIEEKCKKKLMKK